MKKIYLDYAAGTPMDPQVREAMEPYFTNQFYNPSATYLAGRGAKRALDDARATIAETLGARPAEVVFTAGATEANNLAIQGVLRQFPDGDILVSAVEHESVLAPAKLFNHKEIPADERGVVKLAELEKMINDKTVLVSVMLVNNEVGTIQPLAEVSQILNKLSKERLARGNSRPIYLHTDAAQAGNYLDLHVARLGVDLMSINGGKIYGPKQSGSLFIKAGTKLQPLIVGGGQEFGMRSGTENLAAAAGLATALRTSQEKRKDEAERITKIRLNFEKTLSEAFSDIRINGSAKKRAPHITSVTFPGVDNERLMMELDEAGIQAATGSACSASSDKPSYALSAIGLSEIEARSTLRFSFGRQTTPEDLTVVVKTLKQIWGR